MTYHPKCEMSWRSMVAGADDQLRTAEQVLSELNQHLNTLVAIEAIPPDQRTEWDLMRVQTAQYLSNRAIQEAQAAIDAKRAIAAVKEKK